MVSREFNAAVLHYARAVAIIEQGRAKWPGQAGDKAAGKCLTASFRKSHLPSHDLVCVFTDPIVRVVKYRLFMSIMFREAERGPRLSTESINEIERLSDEILHSCDQEPDDNPLTPTSDPWDVAWWVGSYTYMRAEVRLPPFLFHDTRLT